MFHTVPYKSTNNTAMGTFCCAATETARKASSTINELHSWAHVGLTTIAAYRTKFSKVNQWYWCLCKNKRREN